MHKRILMEKESLKLITNIRFEYPPTYPFRPPKLFIHGHDHIDYLTRLFRKYKPLYDYFNIPIECFCCTSLVCLWSPVNTCKHLYDEYVDYVTKLKILFTPTYLFSKTKFDNNVCSLIAQFLL